MVAGLPCYVALSWCHNHDTATAEALPYHSPAADLKETFMAYFNEGMNMHCTTHCVMVPLTSLQQGRGCGVLLVYSFSFVLLVA